MLSQLNIFLTGNNYSDLYQDGLDFNFIYIISHNIYSCIWLLPFNISVRIISLWLVVYFIVCIVFIVSSALYLGSLLVWDYLKPSLRLENLLCGYWILISVPLSLAVLSKQRSSFLGLANILGKKQFVCFYAFLYPLLFYCDLAIPYYFGLSLLYLFWNIFYIDYVPILIKRNSGNWSK